MRHKAIFNKLLTSAQKPHIFGLIFLFVAFLTFGAFFILAKTPKNEKELRVLSTQTTTRKKSPTPTPTQNITNHVSPTTKPTITPTIKIATPTTVSTPTPTPIKSGPTNTPIPQPTATPQPMSGPAPILGDQSAKVTIIEYSDFQCPFCKIFVTGVLNQIKSEYIITGKVKLVFKHFPLSSHANAPKAAEGSECANDQGKFWEFHDYLFETQEMWASKGTGDIVTIFTDLAIKKGMDANQFKICLESGKYKNRVDDDIIDGKNRGVTGTPTFFINDRLIVGSQNFEVFKIIIDEELLK